MASHSSTLAWKLPWTEEPGGLQSVGSWRARHDWVHFHFSLSCIGEGNGNPLQCSCLETPRVGGAWWAGIYGVAQSRTWLKRLSSSISSSPPMTEKNICESVSVCALMVSSTGLLSLPPSCRRPYFVLWSDTQDSIFPMMWYSGQHLSWGWINHPVVAS